MSKIISKLIAAAVISLTAFAMAGMAALAVDYPYPIDTSPTGAQALENIPIGTVPDDKNTDGYAFFRASNTAGASGIEVARDLSDPKNHYLRLWATNKDGTAKQALIQTESPTFGLLEFEVDFMVENTNSEMIVIGNVESKAKQTGSTTALQNMYFLQLTYNNTTGATSIVTKYNSTKAANGAQVTEKLADSYDTGVWYHLKGTLNPFKGTYTINLKKDGDTSEITKEISDAVPFTSDGWNMLRFNIPAYAIKIANTEAAIRLDNYKLKTVPAIKLEKAVPSSGEAVTPSAEFTLGFNTTPTALSLKLNGTDIPTADINVNSDGTYTFTPASPLTWGTAYTITGEATDKFGEKCSINIPFTVMQQPDNLVELGGFYGADGKKLSALQSGEITAKLRFWPKAPQTYTYFMGLYEETDGRVKMIDIKCASVSATEKTDKEIKITVPSDTANRFVKVFVCDTLSLRTLFTGDEIYGQTVLR